MAKKEHISIRDSLTSIMPTVTIRRLAKKTGAVKRKRKVDIVAFIYSLVFGFSVGSKRSIAGMRRTYERSTGTRLVPSAFYSRFTEPLVKLLELLVANALKKLSAKKPRLQGVFKNFREVLACDGTILRLHNALEEFYPSIWSHYMKASAKLHVVMNVVGRGAKTIKIAGGSTHDIHLLRCGRWLKGRLLVFDLAYFRTELFREIERCGGFYLARLKKYNNPLIVGCRRATHDWMVGKKLTDVLKSLGDDTNEIDLDVMLQYVLHRGPRKGRHKLRARVIGVRDLETEELRLYVTNTPPKRLQARNVAAIYAARWEVELLFRELKTIYRIEQIPSKNRWVSECFIYAAVLTLLVSRKLRRWLVSRRPGLAKRVPMDRFAILLETFSQDFLDILIGPRALRLPLARRLRLILLHEAIDPNKWRMHLTERAQMGTMIESRANA
jgi:IS4 transposase